MNDEHPEFDPFGDAEIAMEHMRTTGEKFRLTGFDKNNYFLPPFETCCRYLVPGFSLKAGIALAEKELNKTLPIGRSSRFSLFNTIGVGYRTAKKVMSWLQPVASAFISRWDKPRKRFYKEAVEVGSNAANWVCGLAGIQLSQHFKDGLWQEYAPQFEFIEERCRADIEFLHNARRKIKAGELDAKDLGGILEEIRPYWLQHSLVPKQELQAFEDGILSYAGSRNLSSDEKNSLVIGLFHVQLDFYFHLFASFEVGCAVTYAEEMSELRLKKVGLCRAISSYVKDGEESTCFGKLLEEVRDACSKKYEDIGVRELSMCIPIVSNPNNPPAESEKDRHYKAYKSWRTGKEKPSIDLLEQFFNNLGAKLNSGTNGKRSDPGDNTKHILLCQMAMGVDQLVNQWRLEIKNECANSELLKDRLLEAIARYEVYYGHHLDKQLNKATGT